MLLQTIGGNMKRYGRLVVIGRKYDKEKNMEYWVCKCDCGKTTSVQKYSITSKRTTSCGCFGREQRIKATTKHGLHKSHLYSVWEGIMDRCYNKNSTGYKFYGGRGIKVCQTWHSPEKFIRWAEKNGYNNGLTIDRTNNNGNYSAKNCRFITQRENCLNSRKIRSTNTTGFRGVCPNKGKFYAYATHKGKTYSLGNHNTAKEAAICRDNFIKEKGLDLPLNFEDK